jgi:O-antigen/teichoic acid export membrane protein
MPPLTRAWTALRDTSRSLKNVMWNLVGGVWLGLLIVVATPWYVSRLGLEGYGIYGLWLMMQVMMGLLDAGMGATVIREFADAAPDPAAQQRKRDLFRTLETVYWGAAAAVTVGLVLAAGWIGARWLKTDTLPPAHVATAIRLMAIALGLQFPGGLYSSGLAGLQEHRRMNALQILGNGLRYGGGAAVLLWRRDLVAFFAVQAGVAAIQTFATREVAWRTLPAPSARPAFRTDLLRRVWRFSAGMAATSISAVLLANVDRVVLSKLVPTSELGKYAVAFTATGLLQFGIQPFYRAFFPRYSELVSSGDAPRLREEYFRSCRLMGAVIVPLGVVGGAFAPQLFLGWLGKADPTIILAFRWLLVGITCSGLVWLPAALQQAHGWTRLHAAMIAGALAAGTPAMVWSIGVFGAVGAATVWVVHGVSDATLGLWLMHRKLLIGELTAWYRAVALPPAAASAVVAGLSWWLMPHGLGRWSGLLWAGVTGAAAVGLALTVGAGLRRRAPAVLQGGGGPIVSGE